MMPVENEWTEKIIGAAIEVHRHLGPGLLESAYEECLACEMGLRKIPYERQKALPLKYKGLSLDCGYRLDFVVANCVVIELKAIKNLDPIHDAQMLTYLKLTGHRLGLLLNFHVNIMKSGIKRIALNL